MLNTPRCLNGMVTSPHHLASQAGLQVLRDGGTAVEAAVATAAALAVVYPHMTAIGGDGFWLIDVPGQSPVAIDACGAAAAGADLDLYRRHGADAIPWRGALAANTVAGTVSGWREALALSSRWADPLPLARVLRDAVGYAEDGMPVTASQAQLTRAKLPELAGVPGFADTYLIEGQVPAEGTVLKQPALARTLRRLAADGLDSFYRGPLAKAIAADLGRAGSPVAAADLERHRATAVQPLSVGVRGARLFNFPPPTQGVASLMILALFDRLKVAQAEGFDHVHGLVEATKQAFLVRDREVGDPAFMSMPAQALLDDAALDDLAARIDRGRALAWPQPPSAGDTVWLGVIDGQGRAVSFIQSVYFEFGSGLVLPETGIAWQNRGASFRLAEDGWNALRPNRKPFHTLNPALAHFDDGRRMVYGTMGGEGQPQTQAAVFTRYGMFGQGLQAAVTAPRWLLGRTWGEQSVSLKLESRFDPSLVAALRQAGHDVEMLEPFTSVMGHAGAIVRHDGGVLEGAADPRSDGAALGW
ncbi:MAG TPA: gamma-glutamyltransferase [Arenibaculum sp.]|nr:gamma-glutamyltransferase [Arenibaculum sp.]